MGTDDDPGGPDGLTVDSDGFIWLARWEGWKVCRFDPNGKLDIVECSKYWLEGASDRGIEHICWDGCMFPNAMLETQATWNTILDTMINVQAAHGWD